MTTIQNIGVAIRKWSDVSSKIKAAAAGGVTAGGVTSVLAAVLPDFHPASWLVALITLAVAIVAGYLKGDKVALGVGVTATAADGTVTTTAQSFDLPLIPLHPDVTAAVAAQDAENASVGGGEAPVAADGGSHPEHRAE